MRDLESLFTDLACFHLVSPKLQTLLASKAVESPAAALRCCILLRRSIPEVEQVLAKDACVAYTYATWVLDDRFPLDEPTILAASPEMAKAYFNLVCSWKFSSYDAWRESVLQRQIQ